MSNIKNIETIATQYHNNQPVDIEIENKIQEYEFPWIGSFIHNKMNVLDLGIGDGIILNLLQDKSATVNFNLEVIEGSKQICDKYINLNSDRCRIINGYFETFSSNTKYDLIIMSHILEHVEKPREILVKYGKLLSPQGKIIGIVPNKESIHRRLAVHMGIQEALDTLSPRDEMVGHLRVYSLDTLKEDLDRSNLEVKEFRGFFLKPLSNSQLLKYDNNLVEALLKIGDEVPVNETANIGFIAMNKEIS